MSTNDYGYRLIDADDLGEDGSEASGAPAEEEADGEKEEEEETV